MLAAAGTLPAFMGTKALAEAGPPRTLRLVTPEVTVLTSAFNTAGPSYQISAKIFDGLVDYDLEFNMTPQLATSWEISDDWKTMTFVLREGVTWHDGKPFTSADVAWSAMNVWKVTHPRGRSTFQFLTDVETPDALTVVFKFSEPSPVVEKALHSAESQILPKHLYEGTDVVANPHNAAPIGTGPYRFVAWERGSHVELEKNPDYWDAENVEVERVIVRTISESSARSTAFEAQDVDVGGGMPVGLNDARRLETLDYLQIPEHGHEAFASQAWIEFNLSRPHLKDLRVRQAIAHALDKSFILRAIWMGFGSEATGPISPALAQFYTDQVTIYEHNVEKANQLLDEAGLPRNADGIRFQITHDPMPLADFYFRTGEYFKQALKQIGIEVQLRTQDWATWIKRIYTDNDFDTLNATSYNMPDPCMGVKRYFWSKNIAKGVPFSNASGYSNAEADAMLEAVQVERDPAKRVEQFHKFQQIVTADLPQIPLANVRWFQLENVRLKGAGNTPYGMHSNLARVKLG